MLQLEICYMREFTRSTVRGWCISWTFSFNPLTAVALSEFWIGSKTLLCSVPHRQKMKLGLIPAHMQRMTVGLQVLDWTSNASQNTAISQRSCRMAVLRYLGSASLGELPHLHEQCFHKSSCCPPSPCLLTPHQKTHNLHLLILQFQHHERA